MKHKVVKVLTLVVLCTGIISCGQVGMEQVSTVEASNKKPDKVVGNEQQKKPQEKTGTRSNAVQILVPEATGQEVYSCNEASIDASNKAEGYVCVKYTGTASKVRMLIKTPLGNTYNYLMALDGNYDVYPLSEGDGNYEIGVYENIQADKYAAVLSQSVSVQITNEFGPFLYPNAYVDFNENTKAIEKGKELAKTADHDIEVVDNVYHYLANNVDYDYDKAKNVQSGYIPVVDETLSTGKGICFDYASLMGTMLRTQGIPTRLDIGYAGSEYHAWISVYIKDKGWVDDIISFDGQEWTLMDPTLASYAPAKTVKDRWENRDTHYQLKFQY